MHLGNATLAEFFTAAITSLWGVEQPVTDSEIDEANQVLVARRERCRYVKGLTKAQHVEEIKEVELCIMVVESDLQLFRRREQQIKMIKRPKVVMVSAYLKVEKAVQKRIEELENEMKHLQRMRKANFDFYKSCAIVEAESAAVAASSVLEKLQHKRKCYNELVEIYDIMAAFDDPKQPINQLAIHDEQFDVLSVSSSDAA